MNQIKKLFSESIPPLLLNSGLIGLTVLFIIISGDSWVAAVAFLLMLIVGTVIDTFYFIQAIRHRKYWAAFLYLAVALTAFVFFTKSHMPGKIGG